MTSAFVRRAALYLLADNPNPTQSVGALKTGGLDLSTMQFKFKTLQADQDSPNNVTIRVYNLKTETISRVQQFPYVVLEAGYVDGPYGVVFQGKVRQWRIGKERNTDTYLDILANDGDDWFNGAAVSASMEVSQTSPLSQVKAILSGGQADPASKYGVALKPTAAFSESLGDAYGNAMALARGKVIFGAARAAMRTLTQSYGSTYSIHNGQLNITPLTGYPPGTPVVLNSRTGLIGRAEQTAEGVKFRALMNTLLAPGGLVKIDNKSLNATLQQDNNNAIPYNQRTGITSLASVNADGLYRIYISEFTGNTRGQEWYVDLTGLAIEASGQTVQAYPS